MPSSYHHFHNAVRRPEHDDAVRRPEHDDAVRRPEHEASDQGAAANEASGGALLIFNMDVDDDSAPNQTLGPVTTEETSSTTQSEGPVDVQESNIFEPPGSPPPPNEAGHDEAGGYENEHPPQRFLRRQTRQADDRSCAAAQVIIMLGHMLSVFQECDIRFSTAEDQAMLVAAVTSVLQGENIGALRRSGWFLVWEGWYQLLRTLHSRRLRSARVTSSDASEFRAGFFTILQAATSRSRKESRVFQAANRTARVCLRLACILCLLHYLALIFTLGNRSAKGAK